MGVILAKDDVTEEAGEETSGRKKSRVEKREYLGKGRFKTVFLTKIDETYYAKSFDWPLDSTKDNRLKYITKGVDEFTTELGVWIGFKDIESTERTLLHYTAQMKYSAFELTFMNVGSPDGTQSVISVADYRYKRIDFTYHLLNGVYNQLGLLHLNLETSDIYKTKPNQKRILDPIKPLRDMVGMIKIQKEHDFYNHLCVVYNIKKESIVLDTSLNVTKEQFQENSKPYLKRYLGDESIALAYYKKYPDQSLYTKAKAQLDQIKTSLETDWADFDYIFNTLRPVYGGIMNYLEEFVFSKDETFRKKVDLAFEDTILNTELVDSTAKF
jgi:hypothetical protein